jgi:biotin carboxylase
VSRVVSLSECDVLRSARLRAHLGLPGQSVVSATAFRDKVEMKTAAAAGGLSVPRFRRVSTVWDVLDFAAALRSAVVVKPVAGSGSVGVRVLRCPGDVTAWVDTVCGTADEPLGLIAEEYVDAPLATVEGVLAGGEVRFAFPAAYPEPCLTALDGRTPQSVLMLDPDDATARRLVAYVRRLVRALPTPAEPTSFHAELFVHPTRGVMLCEIACRTGGDRIPDIAGAAFGVDLECASARGQAGLPVELPDRPVRPDRLFGDLLVPPTGGTLVAAPTRCPLPGVVSYRLHTRPGTWHPPVGKVSERIADVLFAADGPEQLRALQRRLVAWCAAEFRWAGDRSSGAPPGASAASV